MKPCRDPETIRSLIRHHAEMALLHQHQVDYHKDRIDVLNEYLHELSKPGFKLPNAYVIAGTTTRSESIHTLASDTHGE